MSAWYVHTSENITSRQGDTFKLYIIDHLIKETLLPDLPERKSTTNYIKQVSPVDTQSKVETKMKTI